MTDPVRAYVDKTRVAYDVVAQSYADLLRDSVAESTWERLVLGAYAEIVRGPVVEAGCGTGRITAHLATCGVDIRGVDLSPGMITTARAEYPGLDFSVGSFLELGLPDASLGGLVSWYSLVHTPPEVLPRAFTEFARVLRPGGRLLLGYKAGNAKRTLTSGYGHAIELDVYEHRPEHIAELIAGAGLTETMRLVRAAEEPERQPQAYAMAVKPPGRG
ncbi:class I SAM-dependent methyltransferase [Actinoplanes sp. M2I2]|uniref:class I SAM-dependent DNA methyltransferase n=1 Tax=Actinoplanes sp. M2I2 TaxID=1734444 RepID=UPI00201FBDEE|nr:class I SAM-dependent methyltransferase [Actinoplanes sp. M2I2]